MVQIRLPTMLTTLSGFFNRNKYKLAIFGLMVFGSLICIFLVAARMAYSDSGRYAMLIWNLFLAWIPFALAYFAYALSWKRWLLYLVLPITAFLWLIFFPNAPYILTDLQHLAKQTASAPLWYDVIVMVWFGWTGLLLGLVSLYFMHDIIRRTFGRSIGWIFVFVVSGLSSFGVYLGRFVRFNSWDILQDPREIAVSLLGLVIDPSLRLIAFTSLFAVFFIFIYLTLYSFGHLLQERTDAG
jgi:uncharacterized membrane protein